VGDAPTNDSLVVMLEDEIDRLRRFDAILRTCRSVEFRHWRIADDFIREYASLVRPPDLICLDHDLFPENEGEPDPGDGRDVAKFLAKQTPCCHVIIHSSNAHAADSMLYTLLEAGWDAERIAPWGDDWIESYWWPTAKRWVTTERMRGPKGE